MKNNGYAHNDSKDLLPDSGTAYQLYIKRHWIMANLLKNVSLKDCL